ncbi:MAG TPA: 50S ribosomal protein L11 methyltransferase [Actinomycetota bacterium]|nr:50S ribosomal protein L11 methyltransferase [Actinomycetota bacterium]
MPTYPDPAGSTPFEWTGRGGPFTLLLSPSVFPPSKTSAVVADALEVRPGETVIDVGCGSGVLSFVAAKLGAGRVYGSDISAPSVEVARANAERLGLADRTEFRAGSLFEPLRDVEAEVVIGDVSGIPDEVAEVSGWFPGGYAGGATGAEVPIQMLETIGTCLKSGGRLYLPTASLQDENRVLAAARRIFGERNIVPLAEREFPLPALVARSKALAKLMADGLLTLRERGSRLLWRLAIWRCERR